MAFMQRDLCGEAFAIGTSAKSIRVIAAVTPFGTAFEIQSVNDANDFA
jgi:hypothetical protein